MTMFPQQPDLDNQTVFIRLWDILSELRQKLETSFQLHPNPSTDSLKTYSTPNGEVKGGLNTFTGSEIDWLVHSWLRNPKLSFSTMRLTVWLGSHIQVPHLAFEFGTVPNIFFYMDYVARTELLTDLEYLDRYYEPANQTYLALRDDSRLSPYISKSLYIREFQSSTSLCYTCSAKEDSLNLICTVAHEMLDRWLTWVDEAQPVPEDSRAVLAERDLFLRRSSAERDPGNKLAVQMFGAELATKLIQGLWGGDRATT